MMSVGHISTNVLVELGMDPRDVYLLYIGEVLLGPSAVSKIDDKYKEYKNVKEIMKQTGLNKKEVQTIMDYLKVDSDGLMNPLLHGNIEEVLEVGEHNKKYILKKLEDTNIDKGTVLKYIEEHGYDINKFNASNINDVINEIKGSGSVDYDSIIAKTGRNQSEIDSLLRNENITLDQLNDLLIRYDFDEIQYINKIEKPNRPSWRQSEIDAGKDYVGYDAQKSFKDGKEVPYGTKRYN